MYQQFAQSSGTWSFSLGIRTAVPQVSTDAVPCSEPALNITLEAWTWELLYTLKCSLMHKTYTTATEDFKRHAKSVLTTGANSGLHCGHMACVHAICNPLFVFAHLFKA